MDWKPLPSFIPPARGSLRRQRGFIINPYAFGAGEPPAPETDPYFASVVSLLHFNDLGSPTSYIDQISTRVWTPFGSHSIATDQVKFGAGSGRFGGGTGDYISAPDHADFTMGASNFTLEYWVRFATVAATTQQISGQCDAAGTAGSQSVTTQLNASNKMQGYFVDTGNAVAGAAASTTTIVANTWYHFVYQRTSVSRMDLFLDGVNETGANAGGVTVKDSTTVYSIGRLGALVNAGLNGWIDDFRLTKGIARYAGSPSNFIPPTAQYPDS